MYVFWMQKAKDIKIRWINRILTSIFRAAIKQQLVFFFNSRPETQVSNELYDLTLIYSWNLPQKEHPKELATAQMTLP